MLVGILIIECNMILYYVNSNIGWKKKYKWRFIIK